MTPNMKQGHAPPGVAPQTSLHERASENSAEAARRRWHFWPSVEEFDVEDDPAEIAATREHTARIAAWEDEPLDPDDDLSLIADYPAEVARLRQVQAAIAAHPIYRVVQCADEAVRRAFLAEATGHTGVVDSDAEAFFDLRLCRCELGRQFADGSPVYRGHRDAARCHACTLRETFERLDHQAVAG